LKGPGSVSKGVWRRHGHARGYGSSGEATTRKAKGVYLSRCKAVHVLPEVRVCEKRVQVASVSVQP
jgi:hypothetical protein